VTLFDVAPPPRDEIDCLKEGIDFRRGDLRSLEEVR
jgi:hypothetical protein